MAALTFRQAEGAPPQDAAPARAGRRLLPYLLLLPGLAWLTIFFVVPIVTLLATSLQTPSPSGEIGAFDQTFRFANFVDAATAYGPQFTRAFLYAGIATVLALLIGYPLAYMIAFKSGRLRNLLLVLVVAPFFTSFILRTVAWRQILGEEGFIVPGLKALHLVPEDLALTASGFAVVAGITYNFLPFMTLPLYASIERLDPRLLEAGADLYGSPLTVLRKVTLPLTLPGMVTGFALTFSLTLSAFATPRILGGRTVHTTATQIYDQMLFLLNWPLAGAIAVIVLVISILVLWATSRVQNRVVIA